MSTLNDLAETIAQRAKADPDSSWTAKLLAKGPEKCAEKFGEEAVEAIIEAVKDNREGLDCGIGRRALPPACHAAVSRRVTG